MDEWRERYETRMEGGRCQYIDILTTLEKLGLPAEFTQTGGMNAAIEIQLETGAHLLITDAEDSLAWRRAEQRGWGVGLYDDPEYTDGPENFESSESNDVETLISLIKMVLQQPQQHRRDRS